ncbi:MAG TPA: allantoinase AllB [Streptosporangiaceae bacterium]|nr:allantoinase AllB [Streptosporangiaceae bacterium]
MTSVPVDQHPDLLLAGPAVTADGVVPVLIAVTGGKVSAVHDLSELPSLSTLPPAFAALPAVPVHRLAGDEVLLPGLVDSHVHVNEPGRTHWEGFATATRAAAAGGVTTIVDMPLNSLPPTTYPAALEMKRAAANGQCWVDVAFWGGAVPGNVPDRAGLHRAGVRGFKCFLADSGVPEFLPLDGAGLRRAAAQIAELGSVLLVHAEDPARLGEVSGPDGADYAAFLRSRPPEAETAAIAAVIDAARHTGVRAHILHVSSADAIDLLAAARAEGLDVTSETCPHYLTLAAEQVPAGATEFKCCPPIRERDNSERLWAGLQAGVIDCVVSDHSPCPPELKVPRAGDFARAWGGIASLQLSLPVVWSYGRERGCELADLARWMAAFPAQLAGLADKGRIAVGCDADLVAFAPDASFVVEAAMLAHRHKLTPYAGRRLTGVVRRTWLRGREIFGPELASTDETAAAGPRGRLL